MTPREAVQEQIYSFLSANKATFTAPYGILTGTQPWGRGKVRSITFGIARSLDANVLIYSPTNVRFEGTGFGGEQTFRSAAELIEFLKETYHITETA